MDQSDKPPDVSFEANMTRFKAVLPTSFFPFKSRNEIINAVNDRLNSLPGFLKASIQIKNPDLKDKVLVTFHSKQGFDTFLNTSFVEWQGSNFVEYIPKRLSSPEPARCRNTSGGVGGFHQLHDYSECNNAVVQKSSFC